MLIKITTRAADVERLITQSFDSSYAAQDVPVWVSEYVSELLKGKTSYGKVDRILIEVLP